MTLQALSESNRRLWLEAMDGKEPVRNPTFLFCANLYLTWILGFLLNLIKISVNSLDLQPASYLKQKGGE